MSAGPPPFFQRNTTTVIAMAILGVFVVVRAWWLSLTWFKEDDLAYLYRAATSPLGPRYLFTRWDGHLMPGAFGTVWIMQHLFHSAWWPVVAFSAACQIAAGVLLWRVLVLFVGERPALLPIFTVYVISPLVLDASMWWAVGMQFLPLQVGWCAVLLLFHRALHSGKGIDLVWLAVAYIATTLYFEKAAFLAPFLVALCAAVPLVEDAGRTAWGRLRRGARPILVLVVVAFVETVLYVVTPINHDSTPPVTFSQIRGAAWNLVTHTLVPSLFGGPWRWLHVGRAGAIAIPSYVAIGVSGSLLVGIVVLSVLLRRRVMRLWLILLGYIAAAVAAVSAGRVGVLGSLTGLVSRYIADAALPAVLIIAFALLGTRFDGADARRVLPGWLHRRLRTATHSVPLGVGVSLALIASALVSLVPLARYTRPAGARAYVERATTTASIYREPVELLPQFVPANVMNALLFPNNSSRVVLLPTGGPFSFVTTSRRLFFVRDDGTVVPGRVDGITTETPAGQQCIARASEQRPGVAPLAVDVFSWAWAVSVTVSVDTASVVAVQLGDQKVSFPVPPGRSITAFQIVGGGATMSVSVLGGSVCVERIVIGRLAERVS